MRLCPSYVLKALKRYNRNLSLKWDSFKNVWVVYHKNYACMVYEHINGAPAVNIVVSELLQQIRENDSHNDEMARIRKAWRQRRSFETAKNKQTSLAECTEESNKYADFFRRGSAKPFIPPKLAEKE